MVDDQGKERPPCTGARLGAVGGGSADEGKMTDAKDTDVVKLQYRIRHWQDIEGEGKERIQRMG